MLNLKDETLEVLRSNGKSQSDVRWVGTAGRSIPLEAFWEKANRLYDNGYGSNEVNESLMVVGDDWWLERHEYDGSEWWEYKEHQSQPLFVETDEVEQMEMIFV